MKNKIEILDKFPIDFCRINMSKEDYFELKTNHILSFMISKINEKRYEGIIVNNCSNSIEDLVLANLLGAASSITDLPLYINGINRELKKKISFSFPKIIFNKKIKNKNLISFSSLGLYDLMINSSNIISKSNSELFPILDITPLDIYQIAEDYYNYKGKVEDFNLRKEINNYIFPNNLINQKDCSFMEKASYKDYPLKNLNFKTTIIILPNADKDKAIKYINENSYSNVIYLKEDNSSNILFENKDLLYFADRVRKTIQTPFELNTFNLTNEDFFNYIFNRAIIFTDSKADYSALIDKIEKRKGEIIYG